MKKIWFLIMVVLALTTANAQKQYGTRNGKISFLATDDDGVKAVNNEVTSRLADNGTISFSLLMKGFKFELAEMQAHFNDKYVQSNMFPRGDFKGAITNIKEINFTKNGAYKAIVKGDLSMHGVTKNITVTGTVTIKDGKVSAAAKFPITMKDFNIDGGGVTSKVNIMLDCIYQ